MAGSGKAVPSKEFVDLEQNMINVDKMVNSTDYEFTNRASPNGNVKTTTFAGIDKLASDQRDNFDATFNAQFAYKRIGNISLYAGDSLPEADKLNSYQYPDDSGEWYGPIQNQAFPITIPSDPSNDNGWSLVSALTSDWGGINNGTQVQHRRGTNADILMGTPAVGELWFNTTDNSVHMGDGVTQGGIKNVNVDILNDFTDYVFKSVNDMLSGTPIKPKVGDLCSTGATAWKVKSVSTPVVIGDFEPLNAVSVLDFGGFPDDSTLCDSILPVLQQNDNITAKFPSVQGSLNTYRFNSSWLGVNEVNIDCDAGVTLSLLNDEFMGNDQFTSLSFVRETRLYYRNLNDEYFAEGEIAKPFVSKDSFISENDIDITRFISIDPSTNLQPRSIDWNNPSATWQNISWDGIDPNFGILQSTGDNKLRAGFLRVGPTDKYTCSIDPIGTASTIAIIVKDSGGYSGIYGNADVQSGLTFFDLRFGGVLTQTSFTLPMSVDQPAYSIANSEISIRIDSWSSYSILFNGAQCYRNQLSNLNHIIEECGVGFYSGGAGVVGVNCIDPIKVVDSEVVNSDFVSLATFGDSKVASRLDSWPQQLKNQLDLANGARAWNLNNYAVPGHNALQQLTIMQATDLTSFNVVVVSVGTNDIQGLTNINDFRATINSMLDEIQNAGKVPLFILPDVFYTQVESGGSGQPSANGQFGPIYRGIIARECAKRGVKVLDMQTKQGPIVGWYKNPNGYIDMVGRGDPLLFDNIHPTTLSNKLTARLAAKAILGIYSRDVNTGYSLGYVDAITVQNGWTSDPSAPVRLSVSKDGIVNITGRYLAGTKTDGTIIGKLPLGLAPPETIAIYNIGDSANDAPAVLIGIDGNIAVYSMSTSVLLSFNHNWRVV